MKTLKPHSAAAFLSVMGMSLAGFACATESTALRATDYHPQPGVVLVDFPYAGYELPENVRRTISNVVADRSSGKKVSKIHVAAWPDRSVSSSYMTNEDQYLTERRLQGILAHLKLEHGIYAQSWNMADRSQWLAAHMDRSKSDLRSDFSRYGEAGYSGVPMTLEDLERFREYGGLSRAVILVTWQTDRR
jgi:hypothetical protein